MSTRNGLPTISVPQLVIRKSYCPLLLFAPSISDPKAFLPAMAQSNIVQLFYCTICINMNMNMYNTSTARTFQLHDVRHPKRRTQRTNVGTRCLFRWASNTFGSDVIIGGTWIVIFMVQKGVMMTRTSMSNPFTHNVVIDSGSGSEEFMNQSKSGLRNW